MIVSFTIGGGLIIVCLTRCRPSSSSWARRRVLSALISLFLPLQPTAKIIIAISQKKAPTPGDTKMNGKARKKKTNTLLIISNELFEFLTSVLNEERFQSLIRNVGATRASIRQPYLSALFNPFVRADLKYMVSTFVASYRTTPAID